MVEICIHASHLAKPCLTDSIECINIQNIVEFTCRSATGKLPNQTIAWFLQSVLGFTRTKLSTAVRFATKSLAVSSKEVGLSWCQIQQCRRVLGSSVLRGDFTASVRSFAPNICFSLRCLHSSDPRISHIGQPRVVTYFSRRSRLKYVLRDCIIVQSSRGGADTNWCPALRSMALLGFHGSPTLILRNSVSPRT